MWRCIEMPLAVLAFIAISACLQPSSGQQATEREAIHELQALAIKSSQPGPQMNVDAQASSIFATGQQAASYDKLMASMDFKKAINDVNGRRVVLYIYEKPQPRWLGTLELRFILETDSQDRIEGVQGRIFLHTL